MHELRIFISVLWSIYKTGQLDLATVAVTTNTTYDLVRRTVDDFNKEMRIPKEYAGKFPDGDVVELYYIDSCLRAGLEPRELHRESIVDFERWADRPRIVSITVQIAGIIQAGYPRAEQCASDKAGVSGNVHTGC